MYTIETMSLYEYGVRMKAYTLKQIDEEYRDHWKAWLNARAKDMIRTGKDTVGPRYKDFRDFFDYRKALQGAGERVESAREERLKTVARRVQEIRERRQTYGEL